MPKAPPPAFDYTAESITKARSEEYFEAWKKEAEQSARLIFTSLPLEGPAIPDELKKEAIELVYRLSWNHACDYMTAEEKLAAGRAKRKEMDEYAWELAKKAAAERWKRISDLSSNSSRAASVSGAILPVGRFAPACLIRGGGGGIFNAC